MGNYKLHQHSKIIIHFVNMKVITAYHALAATTKGDIRLVGVSTSDGEGLVEIYHPLRAYKWSTLCTNDWDDTEAKIVCKQLGYETGKSKHYR